MTTQSLSLLPQIVDGQNPFMLEHLLPELPRSLRPRSYKSKVSYLQACHIAFGMI